MTFYHGTNMLIGKIDISKSRNRVDFGKGFYLTDKLGTAYDWASRKVDIEGFGISTVIRYEINSELFNIFGLKHSVIPDISWLDFICSNRELNPNGISFKEPRHDYNWISGPIADDKVVDVVAEYMRNEISADEAIKNLQALPQTYQLSLHTFEAVEFVTQENVSYKQLKKGRWTQTWLKRH